jgi:ProP effector
MAASLINMLDDLETRLERRQVELQALREENQRLKQQLALKNDAQGQSVPSPETATAIEPEKHSEATLDLDSPALDEEATEEKADSPTAPEAPNTPSPHALLNQWYERYPKAFFKGHTKPLKVGIHQELAEREEWPNKLIRRALANYVNLPRYIKAVRTGAERVDLDGQPAGKVDKEAALHASEKRGDKKESGQPPKSQTKQSPAANQPRQEAPDQPDGERKSEKSEPRKPLSMEDKLRGLQQKFKGR